jgi:hypothetical protein
VQSGEVGAKTLARQAGGGDHPCCDRRAVRHGVAGRSLEGVPNRVPVVQDGAEPSFHLVWAITLALNLME